MAYFFVATLGIHAGLTYVNSRHAVAVSLGMVFFLFVGIATCMRIMMSFGGSFELQLAPFLVFMVGGGHWDVRGPGASQSVGGDRPGVDRLPDADIRRHHQLFAAANAGSFFGRCRSLWLHDRRDADPGYVRIRHRRRPIHQRRGIGNREQGSGNGFHLRLLYRTHILPFSKTK